jgi:hypothetical protein
MMGGTRAPAHHRSSICFVISRSLRRMRIARLGAP